MQKRQFVLERPRPVRDALIALALGGLAVVMVDYLFAGMATFLGFILAAVVIYLFRR